MDARKQRGISKSELAGSTSLQAAVFQNLEQPELRFSVRFGEDVPEVELALV